MFKVKAMTGLVLESLLYFKISQMKITAINIRRSKITLRVNLNNYHFIKISAKQVIFDIELINDKQLDQNLFD